MWAIDLPAAVRLPLSRMTGIELRRTKAAYHVLLVVTFISSVGAAVVLGGGFVLQAFSLPGAALPIVTGTLVALIIACQILRWRLRRGHDERAQRDERS